MNIQKYEMPFVNRVSEEGAAEIWKQMGVDVRGMSVRQARAAVQDQTNHYLGISPEPASGEQLRSLARFGYDPIYSKNQAYAVIADIYESLNLEVARIENLFIAEKVVHLLRREQVTEIDSVEASDRVRLKGAQGTCTLRMLRCYRSDGDYSKSAIPAHYIENGWLRA